MERMKKIMNCKNFEEVFKLKGKDKFDIFLIPEKDLEYKNEYDINVARWLLELIALTYSENETFIKNSLKKADLNLELYSFFNINEAEVAIYYNKNIIIVVLNGTTVEDINDILCDINIFYEKTNFGKIHKGFFEYYKKLRKPVFSSLLKLNKEKNRKIYWTGHSLGGALAVIFALIFGEGVIYTFGSPKVGDKNFAEYCNKNLIHYRIYNEDDLITKLPPIDFLYEHCGKDIFFRKKSIFRITKYINNMLYFIIMLVLKITNKNIIMFFQATNFLANSIASHSVSVYREMLWTNKYDCFIKIN